MIRQFILFMHGYFVNKLKILLLNSCCFFFSFWISNWDISGCDISVCDIFGCGVAGCDVSGCEGFGCNISVCGASGCDISDGDGFGCAGFSFFRALTFDSFFCFL